jgi:hypothetical protein
VWALSKNHFIAAQGKCPTSYKKPLGPPKPLRGKGSCRWRQRLMYDVFPENHCGATKVLRVLLSPGGTGGGLTAKPQNPSRARELSMLTFQKLGLRPQRSRLNFANRCNWLAAGREPAAGGSQGRRAEARGRHPRPAPPLSRLAPQGPAPVGPPGGPAPPSAPWLRAAGRRPLERLLGASSAAKFKEGPSL